MKEDNITKFKTGFLKLSLPNRIGESIRSPLSLDKNDKLVLQSLQSANVDKFK